MKQILFLLLAFLTISAFGQDKYDFVHFNKLIEVEGTEYVIATIEDRGKLNGVKSQYLLFINTVSGETNRVDFPKDAYIRDIEQVRNDRLGINLVIVNAQTIDLDGKKGIEWNEPNQIIILSSNGQERTQLTKDDFFVRTWVVNQFTGRVVITGHYDTNGNGKYDKTDKNEIGIYDLKSLQLVQKI